MSVLRSMPLPYGMPPARPRKLVPIDLPDSMAWRARYLRIDSGMSLQSSPFSMLFLAMFFILARLRSCQYHSWVHSPLHIPVLKPDLHRALSHVDLRSYALACCGSGSRVLIELNLERYELILSSPLSLLIPLLLGESALARRSAGSGALSRGRSLGRGRRSRGHHRVVRQLHLDRWVENEY